jgi:hypothetical protein
MLTPEQKAQAYDKMLDQRKKYHNKRGIRISLILAKAVKAGIVVTNAEVDAEIKRKQAKK